MGSIFRISIFFFVAIFIQSSTMKIGTGTGEVADGGIGEICYTKNEVRTKEIHHGGQTFNVPYYVIVQYCNLY